MLLPSPEARPLQAHSSVGIWVWHALKTRLHAHFDSISLPDELWKAYVTLHPHPHPHPRVDVSQWSHRSLIRRRSVLSFLRDQVVLIR